VATEEVGPIDRKAAKPEELGLDEEVLARFVDRLGPLAIVDLETTGLMDDDESEILEVGAVLIDPGAGEVRTVSSLVKPRGLVPRAVKRLTGLGDEDVADAPKLAEIAPGLVEALAGRTIVAHNAEF